MLSDEEFERASEEIEAIVHGGVRSSGSRVATPDDRSTTSRAGRDAASCCAHRAALRPLALPRGPTGSVSMPGSHRRPRARSSSAAAPAAQADVQPYGTNDAGGFHDILPPGADGADQRGRARRLPGHRPRPAAQRRPARDVPRPGVRDAGPEGRRPRRATSRTRPSASARRTGRAHLHPARRRDDRARQAASASRTSTAPPAAARCSAPATRPPRTACSSWTCCATPAARELSELRRRRRTTRDGRRAVGGRALHRGRPPAPVRPRPTTSTAPTGAQLQERRRQLRRRHQPVHRRGAARPDQDAGRVRRDRQAAGPERLEGDRPDRHRLAGRRHLRQGRRRASSAWPQLADALQKRFGKRKGRARLARLRRPRTPRRRPRCTASASRTRRTPQARRARRRAARPRAR